MLRDQKIVEKLEIFTQALEELVDLMKEDVKKGGADVLDKVVSKSSTEDLKKIISSIKSVKKDTVSINEKVDKIAKAVEAQKKQKESGMFEKVEDPKNKQKIVDGIKVVILIAAGVLAIGIAFKIIGKVDVLSVIALGAAIFLVSKAFAEIASIKGFNWMNMVGVTATLLVIAGSIWLTSIILSHMATITLKQGLTMIFIAAAMSGTIYLLSLSAEKLSGMKKMGMLSLLPIAFPLIAGAIWLSSIPLSKMLPLTFQQGMSLIVISLSMAIAMVGVAAIIYALKDKKLDKKDFIFISAMMPIVASGLALSSYILQKVAPLSLMQMLSLLVITIALAVGFLGIAVILAIMKGMEFDMGSMTKDDSGLSKKGMKFSTKSMSLGQVVGVASIIPIVAAGLVAASWVFKLFRPLDKPWSVLGSSLAISVAIIAMTPTIWIVSRLSREKLIQGLWAIPLISVAIVAASWVFQLGTFEKYPKLDWAIGAGISIAAFGLMAYGLGFVVMSPTFWIGLGAILVVSGVVVASDFILNLGEYKSYPNMDWILGVGATIVSFALIGAVALVAAAFAIPLLMAASAILLVSRIFEMGKFESFPSVDWIKGIGLTMLSFAGYGPLAFLVAMSAIPLMLASSSVLAVDKILSSGTYAKYPTLEWIEGVSASLKAFAHAGNDIGIFSALGKAILGDPMVRTSKAVVEVSNIISKGNYVSYPSKEWSNGLVNSLQTFSEASSKLINIPTLLGISPIIGLAVDITMASLIISRGKFTSSEWMRDMSSSLLVFISVIDKAGQVNSNDLKNVINLVTDLNNIGYQTDGIMALSTSIRILSDSLNNLETDGIDKLMKLSGSFLTLSFIDSVKLNDAVNKIKEKAGVISSIIDKSFDKKGVIDEGKHLTKIDVGKKTKEETKKPEKDKIQEDSLEVLKNIDKNISKIVDNKTVDNAHKVGDDKGEKHLWNPFSW